MGRRRWLVAAAVAAATVVAGVGGSAAAGAGVRSADSGSTTFTVGMTQDIDSLNPFTGIAASSYEMYQLNYDTLTDYRQTDFSAKPALASSWDVSDDGLTWTYHIRPDLKWSDGQPLTANDAAYTFNRIMQRQVRADQLRQLRRALTSVEAPDDTTVVMKVKKPTPIMLHLYVYILPEHIWKDIDEKEVKSFTNEPGPDADRRLRARSSSPSTRRPVHPAEGQPDLLARQAAGRRAGLPDLQERGRAGPGAARRARSTSPTSSTPNVFTASRAQTGIKTVRGDLLRLRRDRLQHRAPRWTTARRSATATRR